MTAKEKMTAPIASVGADVEQPSSNKLTNQSIADLPGKGNLQATNNAKNTAKSANKKNPDDLETVSMMELYDTAYPPKLPIIDGLLYNGTYLFVGSPKIGKSFFMAQIGYHISKGLPLWEFSVRQGTVLYLALEDDYARLQKRLSQMFGMEGSENFYFATKSKSLNAGLEQQLVQFVTNHKDATEVVASQEFLQATRIEYKKDQRMKGSYLVTRFLAFYLFFNDLLFKDGKKYEYTGNLDDLIETTLTKLNQSSLEELEEIRQVTIKSLEMARDILGKGAFRKENNESKPINMNIFETTLYFMTLLPKNNIAVSREELLEKIKTVISSEEFLYYIGNSRDNTMKVYGRFQLMEKLCKEISDD